MMQKYVLSSCDRAFGNWIEIISVISIAHCHWKTKLWSDLNCDEIFKIPFWSFDSVDQKSKIASSIHFFPFDSSLYASSVRRSHILPTQLLPRSPACNKDKKKHGVYSNLISSASLPYVSQTLCGWGCWCWKVVFFLKNKFDTVRVYSISIFSIPAWSKTFIMSSIVFNLWKGLLPAISAFPMRLPGINTVLNSLLSMRTTRNQETGNTQEKGKEKSTKKGKTQEGLKGTIQVLQNGFKHEWYIIPDIEAANMCMLKYE